MVRQRETAFDEVVITRSAGRFAFGRGDDYYGVWRFEGDRLIPVDRQPKTPDGWYRAWARFSELERSPGPAKREVSGAAVVAIALLVASVVLGIASLFPAYLGGAPLRSEADQLVAHLFFIVGWAAAAVLLVWERPPGLRGAAFASGLSVVAAGFYLGDLGEAIAGSHAGAGLALGLASWCTAAAGSAVVALLAVRAGAIGSLRFRRRPFVLGVGALSVGLAATFAPAWDRFHLVATATGQEASITAGNVFANPAWVIAANVLVMVLVVATALVASTLRPRLAGGYLLAGALVPMTAQLASALAQLSTPASAASFGFSGAEAARTGLTITSGLTPAFYLYAACLAALAIACVTRLTDTERVARGRRIVERRHVAL